MKNELIERAQEYSIMIDIIETYINLIPAHLPHFMRVAAARSLFEYCCFAGSDPRLKAALSIGIDDDNTVQLELIEYAYYGGGSAYLNTDINIQTTPPEELPAKVRLAIRALRVALENGVCETWGEERMLYTLKDDAIVLEEKHD